MYAIIKTGGKQYKVSEGDVLQVEKLDAEKDAEVVFDEVLAVGDIAFQAKCIQTIRDFKKRGKYSD